MPSYPAVITCSIACHVPSTLYISFPSCISITPHINPPKTLYVFTVFIRSAALSCTLTLLKVLLKSRQINSTAFLLTRSFLLSKISDQYSMIYLWKNICSILLSCLNYFFPLKAVLKLCTLLSQTNGPIVAWISFTATPGPSLIGVQYLLEE